MTRHIIVRGTKTGLPFSKGLLASSIIATGLSPATAWSIADRLEQELLDSDTTVLSVDELRRAVADMLAREVSDDASSRYLNWQAAQDRDRPLILLIGGATGVGKSTVATQVAGRLGITRIVSTDAVREVMRATISRDLLPHLHVSSFEAEEAQENVPSVRREGSDPLLVGFLRQTAAVTVGVEHIVRRAVKEQMDAVVEGVHLVPGAVTVPDTDQAIVVQCVLTIDDLDQHRGNFTERGQHQRRPRQRYLDHFSKIRLIQEELVSRAEQHGVPVVTTYALDATVDQVTSVVVDRVTELRAVRS